MGHLTYFSQHLPSVAFLGFFPVIYTWLKSRRTAYVQLPIDNDLAETPSKHAASLPLEGWKILLLWIPAACDLTGTTVCTTRDVLTSPNNQLDS